MMMRLIVNARPALHLVNVQQRRTVIACDSFSEIATLMLDDEKKPGSKEPGLRYWPREADTITFQEGLLSVRATGGGGQMRNANAQRANTMIPVGAMRQPFSSACQSCGVRGLSSDNQDGQRCALLTTKSRNTCTRATVFNSSG